jgi:hypothetical protein
MSIILTPANQKNVQHWREKATADFSFLLALQQFIFSPLDTTRTIAFTLHLPDKASLKQIYLHENVYLLFRQVSLHGDDI